MPSWSTWIRWQSWYAYPSNGSNILLWFWTYTTQVPLHQEENRCSIEAHLRQSPHWNWSCTVKLCPGVGSLKMNQLKKWLPRTINLASLLGVPRIYLPFVIPLDQTSSSLNVVIRQSDQMWSSSTCFYNVLILSSRQSSFVLFHRPLRQWWRPFFLC